MIGRWWVFALFLTLGACGWVPPAGPPEVDGRWVEALLVHRPLQVPAYLPGVTLQGGRVVADDDVDPWYPSCRIELADLAQIVRPIPPGRYEVTGIYREEWIVQRAPVRVAVFGTGWVAEGSITAVRYTTEFRLRAAGPADPVRMRCMHWADPEPFGQYPGLAEVSEALGELVSLELSDVPARGGQGRQPAGL